MEKLDKLLVMFGVADVPPHGFDDNVDKLEDLLQSMPPPAEGVVVEDILPFMLIAGCDCCCGRANDGLPIPGLLGAMAGNAELSVPNALSGVMARLCGLGALSVVLVGGGDTGGVDQENVAAGEALFADRERLVEGRDCKIVEEDAEVGAVAHGSPPSMSVPPDGPCSPPRTRASKSASPLPFLVSRPFVVLGPPKLMNSLRVVAVALLAPSSCNLRVCSFSTRADIDLINTM
jgi:hypothetical protein